MSFVVVIPARFASTRLPGKPLIDICGKPMLQHVYERALRSAASAVYIATDDALIEEAARRFTDNVCMTRADHQSGTDRIQEVASQLGLHADAIVVNVQGDEPLIPPAAINLVAASLTDNPEAGISSLYEEIHNVAELHNVNAVKVVIDQRGFALYFSRSPIPSYSAEVLQKFPDVALLPKRHIGIYGYRVNTLNNFVKWQQAPLELIERLEQLRAMHHGVRIHLQQAPDKIPHGVDTPEDLAAIRELLANRPQLV